MGVKISIGKAPIPWRPASEVPHVPKGNMFVLMLVDGNDNATNNTGATLGVAPILTWGKQVGEPGGKCKWQQQVEDGECPCFVLAWHRPDVPVDVQRMDEALSDIEGHESVTDWYPTFKLFWENPYVADAAKMKSAASTIIADTVKKMKEGLGLPKTLVVHHTAGPAELSKKNAPKELFGMKVVTNPHMGDDMMYAQSQVYGGKPNVKHKDHPLAAIAALHHYHPLPVMNWPDGNKRPVLLAWHFLNGPGELFKPDFHDYTVCHREELQAAWNEWEATKGSPHVSISGPADLHKLALYQPMHDLVANMGLANGMGLTMVETHMIMSPIVKYKVEAYVYWPNTNVPIYLFETVVKAYA